MLFIYHASHFSVEVKTVDKLSFTFGVICIILTEFLALREPTYFTPFYLLLMALLLSNRYLEYSALNEHLFMLDFCYFMNLSVVIQTTLFPSHLLWYKVRTRIILDYHLLFPSQG